MAITKVNGGFFDPEHAESLRAFGFTGSAPEVKSRPGPDGVAIHLHFGGGDTPGYTKGGKVHGDAAQDRAMIKKIMAEHDKAEGEGMARGGSVRIPRGMKAKAAQSHSPILSPNNTAPRKPQVTRTPPNEMPGGVMPYGSQPSDESGYEATSPTGATAPMMKRGGRVKALATGGMVLRSDDVDWTDRVTRNNRAPVYNADDSMDVKIPHRSADQKMKTVYTPDVYQGADRYDDDDRVRGGAPGYARGDRAKGPGRPRA